METGRQWIASSLFTLRRWIPPSLRYLLWQVRMLHPIGASHVDVERVFSRIGAAIDRDRLLRLRGRHRSARFDLEDACNYELKLRVAIVKAMVMGLHVARPLRVLDIGHGGGYFVIVCRHFGHTCDGSEVPVERLPVDTAALYAELTAALGFQDEQRLIVDAHRPLALQRTYDVICAQKICFNDHLKPSEWSVPQWRRFIEDACRFLEPGGRIVLELNESVERYGAMRWYDAPLLDYFSSVGQVNDNWIEIREPQQVHFRL
jgi:SAM-dependent methyltransferase